MLDGESFQKVDAISKNQRLGSVKKDLLTETFLALLALVDHAEEQVALSTKDCIYPHLKLYIAIEDVEWCLTEDYSVLCTVLLQNLAAFFEGQGLGAPLCIESLGCVVEITDVDRCADTLRDPAWSIARYSDLRLRWHHPIVELIVEGMLLRLSLEHGNLACAEETEHGAESITISVDKDSAVVHG